jgi:hypothetical protein
LFSAFEPRIVTRAGTDNTTFLVFLCEHTGVYPWPVAGFSGLDVREALALIDDAHSAEDPEEFAERVVEGLARLVPGEVVGYNEREVVSHRLLTGWELPSADPPPEVVDAVSTFCSEYPLSMMRRRSDPRALKISDFLSARDLHRLRYYNHALRPLGIEH